eukprot:GHVU01171558.1.p1 GENE.GHVU01171558.1~~GHVU01171558.1.p1  ORF type:complete len:761 (+),score=116.93 GHVU01171558.1:1864-4146(+)
MLVSPVSRRCICISTLVLLFVWLLLLRQSEAGTAAATGEPCGGGEGCGNNENGDYSDAVSSIRSNKRAPEDDNDWISHQSCHSFSNAPYEDKCDPGASPDAVLEGQQLHQLLLAASSVALPRAGRLKPELKEVDVWGRVEGIDNEDEDFTQQARGCESGGRRTVVVTYSWVGVGGALKQWLGLDLRALFAEILPATSQRLVAAIQTTDLRALRMSLLSLPCLLAPDAEIICSMLKLHPLVDSAFVEQTVFPVAPVATSPEELRTLPPLFAGAVASQRVFSSPFGHQYLSSSSDTHRLPPAAAATTGSDDTTGGSIGNSPRALTPVDPNDAAVGPKTGGYDPDWHPGLPVPPVLPPHDDGVSPSEHMSFNDPHFRTQWPVIEDHEWSIGAERAWNFRKAWLRAPLPPFPVAVIDTGCDMGHPELAARAWRNKGETDCFDGVDDDGNGYVDDCYGWDFIDDVPIRSLRNNDAEGHGTSAAGIISAAANNFVGIVGLCEECTVLCLRAVSPGGTGTGTIIRALEYTVAHGIALSSNSYGSAREAPELTRAVLRAGKRGHIFVTSAGNYAENIDRPQTRFYPASAAEELDNVVGVGASNTRGEPAAFSNYGASSVHLFAPGVLISAPDTGGGYDYRTGTSFAAPIVAGSIALLLSTFHELSAKEVKHLLLRTVRRTRSLRDLCSSGGIVDLYAAITSALQRRMSRSSLPGRLCASIPEGMVWELVLLPSQLIPSLLWACATPSYESNPMWSLRVLCGPPRPSPP